MVNTYTNTEAYYRQQLPKIITSWQSYTELLLFKSKNKAIKV